MLKHNLEHSYEVNTMLCLWSGDSGDYADDVYGARYVSGARRRFGARIGAQPAHIYIV